MQLITTDIQNKTHIWFNLALDLLLMETNGEPINVPRIMEAYDIEEQDLNYILNNDEFKRQMGSLRAWIATSGDNSPQVIQSAIMASSLKEHLFSEATRQGSQVPFKEKLSLLQELNKDLPRQKEEISVGTPHATINLVINPNIRGMREYTAKDAVELIDVTPVRVEESSNE